MKFNGYLKLRIGEAVDLKPTTFSLRHSVIFNKAPPALDPYIVVKVDDYKIGQTHTKQKTNAPTYNEEFCLNVSNGKQIEMAVFHDTPIGYDDFVANCIMQFEDLIKTSNTGETFEGWVSKKQNKTKTLKKPHKLENKYVDTSNSHPSPQLHGRIKRMEERREGVGDTTTSGFDPVLSDCGITVINADTSWISLKAVNVFTLHWKAVSHES